MMTLDELLARVPEEVRPAVARYGPVLIAMGVEEVWAWIDLLVAGKTYEAYRSIAERLPNAELLGAWQGLGARWQGANERNAASLQLQREAALAVLKALLIAATALVGL